MCIAERAAVGCSWYHVINPNENTRMDYTDFKYGLVRFLKKRFTWNLEYNLYRQPQPIYEYKCDKTSFQDALEEFFQEYTFSRPDSGENITLLIEDFSTVLKSITIENFQEKKLQEHLAYFEEAYKNLPFQEPPSVQ